MKRAAEILRKTTGSSIASVLVAFALLMMILAMFGGTAAFAMRLVDRAVQTRQQTEENVADFYLNDPEEGEQTACPGATLTLPDGTQVTLPLRLGQDGETGIVYFAAPETTP